MQKNGQCNKPLFNDTTYERTINAVTSSPSRALGRASPLPLAYGCCLGACLPQVLLPESTQLCRNGVGAAAAQDGSRGRRSCLGHGRHCHLTSPSSFRSSSSSPHPYINNHSTLPTFIPHHHLAINATIFTTIYSNEVCSHLDGRQCISPPPTHIVHFQS